MKRLRRLPLVTIAAAHGAAMGGGAGLLAACDLSFAADDLRIALSGGEARAGRGPGDVPAPPATERPCCTRTDSAGPNVPADEAYRLGLVNRSCPPPSFIPRRWRWHAKPAAAPPARSPVPSVCWTTWPPGRSPNPSAVPLPYHLEARHSAEATEGIAAFREKRPPKWGPRTS